MHKDYGFAPQAKLSCILLLKQENNEEIESSQCWLYFGIFLTMMGNIMKEDQITDNVLRFQLQVRIYF